MKNTSNHCQYAYQIRYVGSYSNWYLHYEDGEDDGSSHNTVNGGIHLIESSPGMHRRREVSWCCPCGFGGDALGGRWNQWSGMRI